MRVWPGSPYPLGATWDGVGVNFALFSEHATQVELCLFDSADAEASRSRSRCPSTPTWSGTATCRTSGRASSTATAFTDRTTRTQGHRFNPNKVVLDPYAKVVGACGAVGRRAVRVPVGDEDDLSFDERDSAPYAPLAAVVDPAFTWGDDRPPRTPWHKTLIYELHVQGFTKLHPDVPEPLRGTYRRWPPSRRSST